MPKIKNLSGKKVILILESFGFNVFKQKGSHIKMVRFLKSNKQILTIPNHKELDKRHITRYFCSSDKIYFRERFEEVFL